MMYSKTLAVTLLPALFLLLGDLPGQGNIRDIRKGPWKSGYKIPDGWVVHKTRYYEVQSQCGMEKAKRLGVHMEAMFKVYVKRFRPTKSLPTKKYTIKLLKSHAAFRAYGAPPGAGAYFSSHDREMVCYDTGKWYDEPQDGPLTGPGANAAADDPLAAARAAAEIYKMDILGAASHEGWHQYFHWYVGSQVSLPSWINEGMGDYFYTARPMKVKGRAIPAQLGRMNHMRLSTIQYAVKTNKHVRVEEILGYDQRAYYSNPAICYAEGWALCQFLLHSGNKDYERIIPKFIHLVDSDTNMPAVTKKSFHGVDFDKLEDEFKAWVLAQKAPEDPLEAAMKAAGRKAAGGRGAPDKAGGDKTTGDKASGGKGTNTGGDAAGKAGPGTPQPDRR